MRVVATSEEQVAAQDIRNVLGAAIARLESEGCALRSIGCRAAPDARSRARPRFSVRTQ